ncbi:sensor histidine kinase [Gloeobacter kilaueensis]|uniref:histidine kinase n=1 Tax=Gloeobacter kilaueensis (strain ATCC BAA-2537 / CCAP 1431/1 / ULC 316 / JS1) TaxID=1183438 RepID=U5QF45_GLOK1|nr:HAMP domain-containing sensor histidine kinase [Gloeobacter kilaueensis]AGY57587.1 multi-sensor signal transduction histidine kinase [Gloeobacter kilaueensis JS1]
MSRFTSTIEKLFYTAIQWSLKHQLQAIAIILLGVIIPIGTLDILQYRAMVQYEEQGTAALKAQMQYLIGRTIAGAYFSYYQSYSPIFHAYDTSRHSLLFSGKPGIARQIIDILQKKNNEMIVQDKGRQPHKDERLALFMFAREADKNWQLSFARDSNTSPLREAAVRRAEAHFFTLSPRRQDTGFQFFYDQPTGLLMLMHTMSPVPLRGEDVVAPPRPIRAVMGVSLDKKEVTESLKYLLNRSMDKPTAFNTSPVDAALTGPSYYFQIKDERGKVLYEHPRWRQNVDCDDFIRVDFAITPEQRFLSGWHVSAITQSNLRQATRRSQAQILIANGVVGLLIGALLVVLFRAGLVAVKVSELQTDIVAGVSHDLKTPLAGIIASAQLLSSGRARGEQETREFSGYILSEARRLTSVVEKVLTMAKLESRQLLMKPTAINVTELVNHGISLAQTAFPEAIIARGEMASGEIYGDCNALTTVLVNLIDNAVRYSGDHQPWVRVQTYWSGFGEKRVLQLLVEDRGVGIPAEEQPFIFQKFYRVRNGLVCDTEGTGLGLAIASQIVGAHKGQILVESRVGIGTTFTVKIPYEQPHFGR